MKHFLAIIAIFLLFAGVGFAQETPAKDSLKIGLVLSGGGAKGFAHIGVLKVLDSIGLKVDYIAGSSMGAIVGSLYASGYSAKQLDSIFGSVNFDEVITDYLPRESKTFYERDNSEKYAVTLPFNKFKLKLPSAISSGQNVYNLLTYLTLPVSDVKEFDKLPIPFFCTATNVETGKAVYLERGNLAQSVTASGAFPSLFQPVIINDQLLIDGGVTNNYPIDELKAKGMDVIIGVDVQDDLATREELTSAPDILLQINNYRTINDMVWKSEKTDIYIKPDIKDFSVISFSEGQRIVKNGESAAREQLGPLVELAKKVGSSNRSTTKFLKSPDSIRINSIKIKGYQKYTRAYVLGKLKLKSNTTVNYTDFSSGVNNLMATNNFDTFEYRFQKSNGIEGYDLLATIKENETTTFFRLGLHYDELYKSAAIVNLTRKRALFDNDVLSFDVVLGDNIRYNLDYFIDRGFYWSVGLRTRFNQFDRDVNSQLIFRTFEEEVSNVNKVDVDLRDFSSQFYVQTLFRKDFALIAGAEHKHLRITSQTLVNQFSTNNDDDYLFENTDYLSVYGNIKLDTYSNRYFPKKGFYFNGDIHWYFYASSFNENFEPFSIAKADIGYAFKIANGLSMTILEQGGFKIGENTTNSMDFGLGGYANNFINNFVSFYGYDFMSITGNSFVKSTFTLDYEFFKKNHFLLAANIGNVEDNIFETGEWLTTPDYTGFAVGYSFETFLGPIEAKYTWSPDTKRDYWFFNLGFWF
ncbi:patatin-like phospholipase family protein [Mangrovimonas sp. DI 80]|uniref:patatin-like phospholipase family protein n=1 Tax=Mangrovimonas sp. DI 80 TaxID=1779330 RepID=UPI00097594E8|nr:patatin-like phospholipase family protein [Mangrovimonas sp. DI 80]OMP32541.1 patatin [Mangrovimonas sp. DI 80]